MSLERYLDNLEREKIKELTESQKLIIIRREAIRRILLGKKNINVNSNNGRTSENIKNNALAYKKFLEKEGFFKKEEKEINIEKKDINFSNVDIKMYRSIIFEIHSTIKNIYSELGGGLSTIDRLSKIIDELKEANEKIISNKKLNYLDINLKERNRNLVSNINKLIHLLKDSEDDIIDYYTNKTEIIKLLKIIVGSTKNLLN